MKYPKAAILSAFFVLFALAAFGITGSFTKTAHAATSTVAIVPALAATADAATAPAATPAPVSCGITTAQIAQIAVIENDATLSYSQEITEELALRKKLVGETIVCAQQDVQTLQADLQAATTSPDSQGLQSQLLGNLSDAADFYNIELTKLNTAGISGSEAIAQEILDWRQGTFIPLSENINNFILWSENQGLFDTAQTRMDQTQHAVSFLEIASPNANLQTALDAAAASFSDAQNKNAAAKAAIAEGLSPDQSLTLIKQSLDSLSATYQGFSNVSTLIKGILPQ